MASSWSQVPVMRTKAPSYMDEATNIALPSKLYNFQNVNIICFALVGGLSDAEQRIPKEHVGEHSPPSRPIREVSPMIYYLSDGEVQRFLDPAQKQEPQTRKLSCVRLLRKHEFILKEIKTLRSSKTDSLVGDFVSHSLRIQYCLNLRKFTIFFNNYDAAWNCVYCEGMYDQTCSRLLMPKIELRHHYASDMTSSLLEILFRFSIHT